MSWKSAMQDAQVLLPACADLSEVALPDYAAEKDYLFSSRAHNGPCPTGG